MVILIVANAEPSYGKYNKMSTNSLVGVFFLALFAHLCTGRVFDPITDKSDNFRMVSNNIFRGDVQPLDGTVSKSRRTRDTGDDTKKPDIVQHEFTDITHNQALLHWSGKEESSVMFMLTRETKGFSVASSTLYRSTNYGFNYSVITMPEETAVVTYFVVSPLDPNRLLFVDTDNRTMYKTLDEGATILPCGEKLPFVPERIVFSPYDKDHLLAYSYTNRSVYVSTDMCQQWRLVSKNVNSRIMWGVRGIDEPGVLHIEVRDLSSTGYRYYKFKAPYTDAPEDMAGLIDMDSLYVRNKYIFVQKSTQFASNLYVSYMRGEFRRTYFPLDHKPLDFTIVNADESQVFIAANHHAGHVSLYLSDSTGQLYTLSLEDVAAVQFSSGFSADLYEVRGLQGVYIANQQTKDKPRTMITFDQGGMWKPLSKPTDKDGHPYKCKSNSCNLHLHLWTSSWVLDVPAPTSEKNAPGIIMAQGSVGSQLENDSSLFVSRDGGMTWRFAHKGDFFHSVLDQGGAMVAVNISEKDQMSNSMLASFDEGISWKSYNFSTNRLQVNGVLNEPGITTLMVSVYGHLEKSGWLVCRADFSPVLTEICTDDKYEKWSPSDQKDHNCLLGQTIVYKRQKEGAECKNGEDYSHSINVTNCTCQEEDFECDYGYSRKGDVCKALTWFEPSKPVGRCPEGETYYKSSGYRKVAADKCQGGSAASKYAPTERTCPTIAPGSLQLNVLGENVVALNEDVTFEMIQDEGSYKSTKYTWQFGDGHEAKELTYAEAKKQVHAFSSKGLKHVTVTASNSKGKVTEHTRVMVEERIQGVEVEEPHGAQVGVPVKFKAYTLFSGEFEASEDTVHYVWDFGDGAISKENRKLTWKGETEHSYTKAANYTCTVMASNAISTKMTSFETVVYSTLVTVQLRFNKELNDISQRKPVWANQFALNVKEAVMALLDVDHTRLEVVTGWDDKTGETIVDVSILPRSQLQTNAPDVNILATTLSKRVNDKHLTIELDKNDYGRDENVQAIKAEIITPDRTVHNASDKNLTALYVCLPIALVVTALVIGLVVFYYRRKSRMLGNRYRLLRSRSQRPDEAGNSLLDDDDDDDDNTLNDDDDDPLLDPNNPPDNDNRLVMDAGDPLGVVSSGQGQ